MTHLYSVEEIPDPRTWGPCPKWPDWYLDAIARTEVAIVDLLTGEVSRLNGLDALFELWPATFDIL